MYRTAYCVPSPIWCVCIKSHWPEYSSAWMRLVVPIRAVGSSPYTFLAVFSLFSIIKCFLPHSVHCPQFVHILFLLPACEVDRPARLGFKALAALINPRHFQLISCPVSGLILRGSVSFSAYRPLASCAHYPLRGEDQHANGGRQM